MHGLESGSLNQQSLASRRFGKNITKNKQTNMSTEYLSGGISLNPEDKSQ